MSTGCLDDAVVVALLDGQLLDTQLADVQRHLASCSQCVALLADAARGARASVAVAEAGELQRVGRVLDVDPELAHVLTPGASIDGKYRVERLLGHGGMGSVVAARHTLLGHSVAIKVLRRAGADAAARFLREAKICANISNDHIVRVFDMGRLACGTPYLVMEHLLGQDLAREVAHGPVSLADTLRFMLETCAALEAAHKAGIVHRDLKPANLFLVKLPGGAATVKVLDFGISKHVDTGDDVETFGLTSTGVVLGSPLYMSPEQLRAEPDIDARTDIWSLGVILYELLTRRPPFRAPTVGALAVSIATAPYTPISTFRSDLPSTLEVIVHRCLQKEPQQRYPSVAALRSALANVPLPLPCHTSHKSHPRLRAASWVAALAFLSGQVPGSPAQLQTEYTRASAQAPDSAAQAQHTRRELERNVDQQSFDAQRDAVIASAPNPSPLSASTPDSAHSSDTQARPTRARGTRVKGQTGSATAHAPTLPREAVSPASATRPARAEPSAAQQRGPFDTPD